MKNKYRVWTKNFGDTVSIMNDWSTYAECMRLIIGRWGHRPPFAFISRAGTTKQFKLYNGE